MSRPTILVFDDDLVHHGDLFEALPARVVLRPHADRCLEDVASLVPALVLMDFSMHATLTGQQAVLRLREVHPLGTLTIVAISSDARMNRLMLEAGANDAIVKGALAENIRQILGYLP
jgi:CheY-like chemotaxis protein